jgi:agmatine deiminase
MNWLVGNGFVAAMAFGDVGADAAAKAQLEGFFPGRDVHMIDANTLWSSGGGIHCVTNDQPALP